MDHDTHRETPGQGIAPVENRNAVPGSDRSCRGLSPFQDNDRTEALVFATDDANPHPTRVVTENTDDDSPP